MNHILEGDVTFSRLIHVLVAPLLSVLIVGINERTVGGTVGRQLVAVGESIRVIAVAVEVGVGEDELIQAFNAMFIEEVRERDATGLGGREQRRIDFETAVLLLVVERRIHRWFGSKHLAICD